MPPHVRGPLVRWRTAALAVVLAACSSSAESGGVDASHVPDGAPPTDGAPGDVSIQVLGPGMVENLTTGEICRDNCTLRVTASDGVVRLEARPDAGAHFAGWGGDCESAGGVVRAAARPANTCSATFEISQATWARAFGGSGVDIAYSLRTTSDGGLVVAGHTESLAQANQDAWVVKLDGDGQFQWQKALVGEGDDQLRAVVQTDDRGFLLVGQTDSAGEGGDDLWIVRLGPEADVLWQKTLGGAGIDWASEVIQTSDGGFVISAETTSWGAGDRDAWLVKLDDDGEVVWQSTYGQAGMDAFRSVAETSDGLYAAGFTKSFGAGKADMWVASLDNTGASRWHAVLGTDEHDYGLSVQATGDGGAVAAGWNVSQSGEVARSWVVRLTASGEIAWQRTYGAEEEDLGDAVLLLPAQELALTGATWTWGEGGKDFSLYLIDLATGDISSQHAYGGTAWDWGHALARGVDGSLFVGGRTFNFGAGEIDFWVLKTDPQGDVSAPCAEGIANTAAASSRSIDIAPRSVSMARQSGIATPRAADFPVVDTELFMAAQCAAER